MQIIDQISELRRVRAAFGSSVGVVLTMGALHDGHLALVRAARADHERVLVTIFVNPTQFAAGEDFSRYPRPIERDLDLLRGAGVDAVFTPTPAVMYPDGYQTRISVAQVTQGLEGAARPGHFEGVATVVAKFFNLTQPTSSYFGQKDAQQVVVIRRMVRDLDFPLRVVVVPTVRERDGLALSSRNVYLTPEQRTQAPLLKRALDAAADAYEAGERAPADLRAAALDALRPLESAVEYVAINDPRTLAPIEGEVDHPLLMSLVVRFGQTRLLDNALLPGHLNTAAGLSRWLGG